METGKSATDILKLAILLERKGKAFYTQVARQTESKAVKQVFETMAEEEDAHINFLSKQYKHYEEKQTFLPNELHVEDDHAETDEILSAQVKKEISAASFEAAAISAAIEFENKAIEVYSDRAKKATDSNEKEMYQMLADWEKTHHKLLFRMNEDLKEDIWNDNNFWPF
jgi:rubrerythrin